MKRKTQITKINKDYLREVVKKSGLSQGKFGVKIGQTESFIYNAIYRGHMYESTAKLICEMFGCNYDKLTSIEEDKPQIKKVMMADDKSIEALANCMVRIEAKLDTILETLT